MIYYVKLLIDFINKNNIKNIIFIGKLMGVVIVVLVYKIRFELFEKLILIILINKI